MSFLLGANPAIRYNLFLLNLFFQEPSGASSGRSACSGKNRFIQKRISAAIRAMPIDQGN
jgi:hypothetical protein